MKIKYFNIFCLLVLTCSFTVQIGCSSFPPPHANSFYTKDEVVAVKMLTCGQLATYKKDWEKCFKTLGISYPCPEGRAEAPVLGAIVAIAAPLAFDYVKNHLKLETENYEQQFGTTYFDTFWRGPNPKYYGFEITRMAKRYNAKSQEPAEEAFKMVYGLAQDREGFFWAAPLFFQTNKTKAKVVDWPWGGMHRIDTKVEISLDAVWIDEQKKYHKENIAKFDPLMIKNYEIVNPKVLKASCKDDENCPPLEAGLNSFPAIPVPSNASSEGGKFWLTVLITESDTAKTKKYINDLSDLLDKSRDKIIDFVKKPSE